MCTHPIENLVQVQFVYTLYTCSNWSLVTFVTLFLLLANKVKGWLIVIATTVSVVGVTLVVVGVILSKCQDESKYKSAVCITSQSPSVCP